MSHKLEVGNIVRYSKSSHVGKTYNKIDKLMAERLPETKMIPVMEQTGMVQEAHEFINWVEVLWFNSGNIYTEDPRNLEVISA